MCSLCLQLGLEDLDDVAEADNVESDDGDDGDGEEKDGGARWNVSGIGVITRPDGPTVAIFFSMFERLDIAFCFTMTNN